MENLFSPEMLAMMQKSMAQAGGLEGLENVGSMLPSLLPALSQMMKGLTPPEKQQSGEESVRPSEDAKPTEKQKETKQLPQRATWKETTGDWSEIINHADNIRGRLLKLGFDRKLELPSQTGEKQAQKNSNNTKPFHDLPAGKSPPSVPLSAPTARPETICAQESKKKSKNARKKEKRKQKLRQKDQVTV